jgi:two-component system CheB/CheR fusion protein
MASELQSKEVSAGGLIVGIGASAGGLAAFKKFLANTPADSGMAFILVQHLDPHHKTLLVELLASHAPIPVVEAADGLAIRKNCVFVIPRDATLTLKDGLLAVATPAPPRELRRPIDTFFSSLAEECGPKAVAIVLSGVGSDGARGVRVVKEHGGLTLAQAEFNHVVQSGMPHSAVATGMVDRVVPVEAMPALLIEHQSSLGAVAEHSEGEATGTDVRSHLAAITGLLRAAIDHDFSGYKENTLIRRIQRRMHVLHIEDAASYVERLKIDRDELQALFQELLIGVTQFFRDPDALEALKSSVLVSLIAGKPAGEPIRIWVPGCATGEEVYSIAILLAELMGDTHRARRQDIKIFGTDIDDAAISTARAASYRQPVMGVSPERLERWFTKEGNEYRLRPEIRELCVFSVHSIIKDPPFSRLDLISCRNVLIYLDQELQDKAVRAFHYALNTGGTLFLGTSERIMRHAKHFAIVDDKHRIFQRLDAGELLLPFSKVTGGALAAMPLPRSTRVDEDRIDKSVQRVMEQYAPAYFVVDRQYQIRRFSGSEARHYLEPSPGVANLNLFSLLQKTLRAPVKGAVEAAFATQKAVVKDDLMIQIDGKSRPLMLIVEPILSGTSHNLCVVAFRDTSGRDVRPEAGPVTDEVGALPLEEELRATKAQLQATVDQLEVYVEDMKSTTEEYQAVTEELQSSNEELETAKEELQSVNEELQTINSELQTKNDAMLRLNSDLKNLLDSTEIATVFLDDALRIKHYTPPMEGLFSIRDVDRGRPITDVVTQLVYEELRDDVNKVGRTLGVVERELDLKGGAASFLMRIRPYRTVQNLIDGVVITFTDISANKRAQRIRELFIDELQHRTRNLIAIVQSISDSALAKAGSLPDYRGQFNNRLQTLARVQGLLSRADDRPVTISDLVHGELKAIGVTVDPGRVVVAGPPMKPYRGDVQLLMLAFHELATNALKYGALKDSRGRLAVRWQILDGTKTPQLELTWVESGLELNVSETNPLCRGFGWELLEQALPFQLDATSKLEIAGDGIRYRLVMPWRSDAQGDS